MGRVLPLLGLRAFAETGRRGSVKAAAGAVGVTPGAVSQQIKQLEERFGFPLFERSSRGICLTAKGARLHAMAVRAFDLLEAVVDTVDAERGQRSLTVSTVPAFAASWLVPRLGAFSALHPDIEVRVEATAQVVDLERDRVDVALRHGLGDYPGHDVMRLFAPVLLPVASPRLLASGPPIQSPADCLRYTLLQDSDRADWTLWLRSLGEPDDPRSARGPSFDDDVLLIRAAVAGQGIALVRDVYAAEEIASGRLKLAIDRPWPSRFAYYAVTRTGAARPDSPVAAFLEWLAAETGPG